MSITCLPCEVAFLHIYILYNICVKLTAYAMYPNQPVHITNKKWHHRLVADSYLWKILRIADTYPPFVNSGWMRMLLDVGKS